MSIKYFKRILVCYFLLLVTTYIPIYGQWTGIIEKLVDIGAVSGRNDALKKMKEVKFGDERMRELNSMAATSGLNPLTKDADTQHIYSRISSLLSEKSFSFLNSVHNMQLSEIGKKSIGRATNEYITSLVERNKLNSLEEAFDSTLLEIASKRPDINKVLLHDINKDKRLLFLFQKYPETLQVYLNTYCTTIQTDLKHLLYWGVSANKNNLLFPKSELVNSKKLIFDSTGKIMLDDISLGYVSKDNSYIECYTSDLLNLAPYPNKEYKVENSIIYQTDELGRIVKTIFEVSNDTKKKSKLKSSLKEKDILLAKKINEDDISLWLVPSRYKGVACYMNIIPIARKNKSLLKSYSKIIKMELKRQKDIKVSINLVYNASWHPYLINITIGESKLRIINEVHHNAPILLKEENAEKKLELLYLKRLPQLKIEQKQEENMNEDESIFEKVEQMPEFPNGGMAGLMQYLSKNIKYPTIAQENGTQGRVTVQFVVNRDGSIVNAKVLRGVDPYLNKEAIRVISSMPKWNPGIHKGKRVRVMYTVPVMFKLQ